MNIWRWCFNVTLFHETMLFNLLTVVRKNNVASAEEKKNIMTTVSVVIFWFDVSSDMTCLAAKIL